MALGVKQHWDDSPSVPSGVERAEFETSDGARLAYRERGAGPPVIMVHGLGQSSRIFEAQIATLSRSFRVIAFDHRGHGLSPDPGYGYRVSRLAADVRDLLAHLDLGAVDFICHSLGCSVFFNYVDLFSCDCVRRLVLVDQPPVFRSDRWWDDRNSNGDDTTPAVDFDTAAGVVDFFGKASDPAMLEVLVRCMVSPAIERQHLDVLLAENAITLPHWKQSLLLSNRFQDYRDVLRRIRCPTLLVGAEGSFVEPGVLAWMQRRLPLAETWIFRNGPGSSHFMFLEAPSAFNERVLDFLQSERRTTDSITCTRKEGRR